MIQNNGHLLLEDPDIVMHGSIPPGDSLLLLFPSREIDARLYEWVANIRVQGGDRQSGQYMTVPSWPDEFTFAVSANQVLVTPKVVRETEIWVEVHGHIVGPHTLLKKELKGLTSTIIFEREPGDTTDLTTLDWSLYNWEKDTREYTLVDDTTYVIVEAVDQVTITLNSSVTSWVSTRLLGSEPGSGPGGDGKVKVSSNDTTPDYLLPKLQAGANITITEINDGGNERVEIAATGVGDNRYREKLGPLTGANQTFTTSQKFTRTTGKEEWVYYNGVLQEYGATEDYTVGESGGAGTGFDTINFSIAPKSKEKLEIIYIPA